MPFLNHQLVFFVEMIFYSRKYWFLKQIALNFLFFNFNFVLILFTRLIGEPSLKEIKNTFSFFKISSKR